MAGTRSLVLRPWIRELVLGSETLPSPQAGQLLQVLQEAGPGTSHAPDKSEVGAALLVSDGTHSIRCQVTREALNASDWEEKEVGFQAEGRLLLLQDCGVRIQVSEGEGGLPSEFYLQLNHFSLLPTEQPRDWVTGCNQDPDVQKKLSDCLEEHLSEFTSPNAGLSLSQLLDEVQEEQEHQGAPVRRAESCLMLSGHCTAPLLTCWATSRSRALEEAVYTVPSLWLHISENDQQILNSLGPGRRAQSPELSPPALTLEELSLTLISPSSLSSSGTPILPSYMSSEESVASVSLLPALSLAAPDPVQKGHVTRPQKSSLEFKKPTLPPKNWLHSSKIRTNEGVLESSPVWEPPKRHRDGSAFQYEYGPPCTSLCAQVQGARLPPQLLAWALHFLMEPQLESEQTQV
ncbi:LOW QUALITY PROTEIN: adrenocortical dysplasia protein homolog [Hipposideros larvatus]